MIALALIAMAAGPARAQDPGPPEPVPALASQGGAIEVEDLGGEERDPSAPEFVYEAVFEDDLYIEDDLTLHGLMGYGHVDFSLPQSWEVAGDVELIAQFHHSGELLPDQSNLTVLVNNVPVGTVALDATNASGGELKAMIPASALQDFNSVTFAGTHKRSEGCQDPYDMSLWTRVSKRSMLRVPVRRRPVEGELLEYPFPLFDDVGFGPAEVTWVADQPLGDESLQALGELALGLGRVADYRGVEILEPVYSVEAAKTHALLLGQVSENARISELVDTSQISGDQGLVAIVPNPADPALAVLVVTGHTGKAVLKAARGLNANPRFQTLMGDQAIVSTLLDTRPPESRQEPLPLTERSATFAELGLKDQTARGYYAPQFRVPIVLEGDAQARPEGGRAEINYAYSPGLDTRLSTIEVRLNGVTLRSMPLDDAGGDDDASLDVRLPPEVVEPRSYLDVVFHLFPEDYDACAWRPDETHWATLYASSEVSIPRDNYAMLPDLGRLRFRGWPLDMEHRSVAVVVADDAPPADLAAAAQFIAQLGAWSSADDPQLEVLTASEAANKPAAEHRVLLVGEGGHGYFNGLVNQKVFTAPGDVRGQVSGLKRKAGYSYIEAVQSPRDPALSLVALRGGGEGGLAGLVAAVSDSRVLARLDRNLAVITDSGRIQTVETAAPIQVGEIPATTRARLLLQRHWASWGLFAVVGAVAFAGVVSGWASRRGGEV
jgi:hypothetical protein